MSMTSDERREVAERLRGNIVYARMHDLNGDCAMGSDKCVETRCTLYDDIASCIEECGNFNLSAEDVFTRLADLLDPKCHLWPSHDGGFGCDRCYTWFPEMKAKTSYCPNCGARVVTGNGE